MNEKVNKVLCTRDKIMKFVPSKIWYEEHLTYFQVITYIFYCFIIKLVIEILVVEVEGLKNELNKVEPLHKICLKSSRVQEGLSLDNFLAIELIFLFC